MIKIDFETFLKNLVWLLSWQWDKRLKSKLKNKKKSFHIFQLYFETLIFFFLTVVFFFLKKSNFFVFKECHISSDRNFFFFLGFELSKKPNWTQKHFTKKISISFTLLQQLAYHLHKISDIFNNFEYLSKLTTRKVTNLFLLRLWFFLFFIFK